MLWRTQKDNVKGSRFALMWLVEWRKGRYSDQNEKNSSLTFAISQPPPSIHLTVPSHTYQSPRLSASVCRMISLYYLPLLYLLVFISVLFSPFNLFTPLIIADPFQTPRAVHSCFPGLIRFCSVCHVPFSFGWWGPGRAGSASSLDPRPPPPRPGRRTPQSPSSPFGEIRQ